MLPTPSTSHVDYDRIYEPAEDSFLFLDTLSSVAEIEFLKERFRSDAQALDHGHPNQSPLIVEIGTGSGLLLAFLTAHAETIFGRSDVLSLGVDVNQYACKASTLTVEKTCQETFSGTSNSLRPPGTGIFLGSINADLTSTIRPGTVDVLIFNPPYVPTPETPQHFVVPTTVMGNVQHDRGHSRFEDDSKLLALSYAGGLNGMEVTDRLLNQLPQVLDVDRGVAYVLLCKQNNAEQVIQRIRQWGAEWVVDVVGRSGKQGGWESLQILRICRNYQLRSGSS
ncbi:MAG: hypothetical protein Q9220_000572 [cf. Caloplaca sp. 1 TL-2023]